MERRRPTVDGVSRFLSVLAILVTGGASLFLYQQNQQLNSTLSELTKDGGADNVFEKHAETWDAKLTGALNQFSVDAKASLSEVDGARTARNDIMENAIRLSVEDVRKIVADQLSTRTNVAKPVVNSPQLQLVDTVLKPADGTDGVVMIANDGDMLAEIESVSFQPIPDSQFKTPLPAEPDPDQVVIRFSTEHNKPTKAGHHNIYELEYLLRDQTVPAKDTVEISVEIRNDRHLDWGMRGELRLNYTGGKTLVIPSIRAVFVPEKMDA